jgi:hypothetical protein
MGGAARKAPAQAELRPTCAGASHMAQLSVVSETRSTFRGRVGFEAKLRWQLGTDTDNFFKLTLTTSSVTRSGERSSLPWLPAGS